MDTEGKMKPSDKKRRRLIRWNSPRLSIIGFSGCGVIFLLADLIVTVITLDWRFTLFLTLFSAIYLLLGLVFIPYINKVVSRGQIQYPVAEQKWDRRAVLAAARTIEKEMPYLQVSVWDGWIDVSLNWKNILGISFSGVIQEQESFKKMFLLSENCTYQELDMESVGTIRADLREDLFISRRVFYGHIRHKKISVNLAIDRNAGNAGIITNGLDTDDITNYMHKWFADKGYALAK